MFLKISFRKILLSNNEMGFVGMNNFSTKFHRAHFVVTSSAGMSKTLFFFFIICNYSAKIMDWQCLG